MAKPKSEPPESSGSPGPSILTGRHRETLSLLFSKPERRNIAWNDVVSMMTAAGAVVVPKGGSAHGFLLNGKVLVVHRPHPGKELPVPAIKRIRSFLNSVGVRP